MLKGAKILLGISGGIAAYKMPLLIRLLVKEGAEVKVILTENAKDFVTPLTLSTLSGNPVLSEFYNKDDGSWNSHIDLGNWADIYLIAPATANTIGKMANGLADNLLVASYLAAKCPVIFAPAMDVDMFEHSSTQNNIKKLQKAGNAYINPDEGELASGLCGAGRLKEPTELFEILKDFLLKKKDFNQQQILINAGPTYENIDPVRFIGNYSSGKMGYAIAEELANRGARVNLVSGPVHISTNHPGIELTKVTSAEEMYLACISRMDQSDIIILAAAVADYTPKDVASEKLKKKTDELQIALKPTKDILAAFGKGKKENQTLVGFALETENEIENAKQKLRNKNLDLIVLNSLKDEGAGFGTATNKISIINRRGSVKDFELKSKKEVARDIADSIIQYLKTI
jgi:phosphopantothenoylcysteine decarboxylase/phosphopantothenate--cysteine ligase